MYDINWSRIFHQQYVVRVFVWIRPLHYEQWPGDINEIRVKGRVGADSHLPSSVLDKGSYGQPMMSQVGSFLKESDLDATLKEAAKWSVSEQEALVPLSSLAVRNCSISASLRASGLRLQSALSFQ